MKTVSYTPDRVDEVLFGTDILKLRTEIADMNVERVIFRDIFFFPYTLEKIRETGTYTMCYFPDQYKGDIMQFGTRSGRNTDKMDQTKLTPFLTPDGYPAYKEARIIIECKLIAASTVSKDEFYTDEAKTFLQEGYDEAKDWHKLVYGEITNILIKK